MDVVDDEGGGSVVASGMHGGSVVQSGMHGGGVGVAKECLRDSMRGGGGEDEFFEWCGEGGGQRRRGNGRNWGRRGK